MKTGIGDNASPFLDLVIRWSLSGQFHAPATITSVKNLRYPLNGRSYWNQMYAFITMLLKSALWAPQFVLSFEPQARTLLRGNPKSTLSQSMQNSVVFSMSPDLFIQSHALTIASIIDTT
jgi:hypothetical protein